MSARQQRIAELIAARDRIDKALEAFGVTRPAPTPLGPVTATLPPGLRASDYAPEDTRAAARFLLRRYATIWPEDDDVKADRGHDAVAEANGWVSYDPRTRRAVAS